MYIPYADSPVCCDQKDDITSLMIAQMLPGILQDFRVLCERHRSMRASKRLRMLSRPTITTPKYFSSCPCRKSQTRIEIVRMEQPVYTRTEQLAYPRVSKLLKLKEEPLYSSFNLTQKKAINAMINKSLHSLYSRLSNTQPPKKPKKVHKWSANEWAVHRHYMTLLSRPKKVFKEEEPIVKSHTITSLKRTKRLAKPKTHVEEKPVQWHLTDSLKNYVPSKRLVKIAKPKVYPLDDYDGFKVKPAALYYNATNRIKILAKESHRTSKMAEVRENPFQTSLKAMKAKTTQRVIDLSQPKQFHDYNHRAKPFTVSRNALSYRISNRIKELAKPKVYAK